MSLKLKSFITIGALAFLVGCGGDDASDFRVSPVDGGKSVAISEYHGNKQTVRIPSRLEGKPVTAIGNGAFSNKKLINVTIPNSVTTIGRGAFVNNQLTSITIPNSVRTIEVRAFDHNQLNNITIGENVDLKRENISPWATSDAFNNSFTDSYAREGRKAGTYRQSSGGAWTKQ